jgi:hypothetical protein
MDKIMHSKTACIVTSINPPTPAVRKLSAGAIAHGLDLIVVGDTKSPPVFDLHGCRFFSIDDQLATGLRFAAACPTRHYARKNVGYLVAMAEGFRRILETDDDNFPRESFFVCRQPKVRTAVSRMGGWVNAYRYFNDRLIWPRGLPLNHIHDAGEAFEDLEVADVFCPIQQGLADDNPDVDAIYRLILPLPQRFRNDRLLALGEGSWCPFNSQNTLWWHQAFPLLYLPAHCPFRMTDIWRSFVAQRIAWTNGWHLLFHGPTVYQERNVHDLMADFADEMLGYLNNDRIRSAFEDLKLSSGELAIPDNMRACYRVLVDLGVVGVEELPLLETWLEDIADLNGEMDKK